jgi:transcription antitermination factor NusG
LLINTNDDLGPRFWFAIETRPRYEKTVAAELRDKEIEVFLPLFSEKHRWSDRQRLVEVPVFPSYVFVRIESTIGARVSVLRTRGAMRFVGNRGLGAAIPSAQLESVRNIITHKVPFSPHAFLGVGTRVRIRGGSLEGIEGILAAINGDQSLIVDVELIRRSLAIRVEGYRVERVSSSDDPLPQAKTSSRVLVRPQLDLSETKVSLNSFIKENIPSA